MAERIQSLIVHMLLGLLMTWAIYALTSLPSQAETRKNIESLVLAKSAPLTMALNR